jgi:rhamnose transport system ATP-binding protein
MAMLSVKGLSKSFGGVRALSNVALDLEPGEIHALVGENGAGKSTLIKILSGAHARDAGTITIGGESVAHLSPQRSRALGIAVIYQQPALLLELSVAENVAQGSEPMGLFRRIDWAARRSRTAELLARLGLTLDPDTRAGDLSMPEKQLVEIARALGEKARVLILDEPTASLSGTEVRKLLVILNELRAQGLAIVYVSHRLEEIFEIADRVTVLRDGTVVETRKTEDLSHAELIRLMVGRELASVYPERKAPGTKDAAVVLEARSLGCRRSGIRDVSLSLRAGEILGLFGLVHSGRTELARVLFGMTPADSGEMMVLGKSVTVDSPGRAGALGIAYVPEDRRQHGIIAAMPVSSNCTLAVLNALRRGLWLDREKETSITKSYVERLQIKTASLISEAGTLSGGNQQKVSLARSLATGPKVLILDEPTQGVDVGAKAEIHGLIADLAAQGLAVLMISSEVLEILGMSDRIAVMSEGTIVGEVGAKEANPERLLTMALGRSGIEAHAV